MYNCLDNLGLPRNFLRRYLRISCAGVQCLGDLGKINSSSNRIYLLSASEQFTPGLCVELRPPTYNRRRACISTDSLIYASFYSIIRPRIWWQVHNIIVSVIHFKALVDFRRFIIFFIQGPNVVLFESSRIFNTVNQ